MLNAGFDMGNRRTFGVAGEIATRNGCCFASQVGHFTKDEPNAITEIFATGPLFAKRRPGGGKRGPRGSLKGEGVSMLAADRKQR
jgi:hypothetical protein